MSHSKYLFLPLGALFGFLLSRAGATTQDFYATLFLFEDLQLLWVIAAAAGTGAVGIAVFKRLRARSVLDRQALNYVGKGWRPRLLVGAVIFGAGWGLAGACPGTSLAMLGEGKLGSLFVLAGLLLGTYAYGWQSQVRRSGREAAAA